MICFWSSWYAGQYHYNDVIMGVMAFQITNLKIVYWTVYSGADQRKHQSSESLAFVRGIHQWPVNIPHKRPVTWNMLPFDDVIMYLTPFILVVPRSYNERSRQISIRYHCSRICHAALSQETKCPTSVWATCEVWSLLFPSLSPTTRGNAVWYMPDLFNNHFYWKSWLINLHLRRT